MRFVMYPGKIKIYVNHKCILYFTDMSHIYVFKLYLAVCNIHETYICVKYICLIENICILFFKTSFIKKTYIYCKKYIFIVKNIYL